MVTPLNMVLGDEDSGFLCTDQTQPAQAAFTSEVEKNRQMQATSDTKRFWLSFDFNQNDARASRLLINYSQSIQFYPQTFCHLSNLFFSTTFELSKLVLKYKQPLPSSQGPHPTPLPPNSNLVILDRWLELRRLLRQSGILWNWRQLLVFDKRNAFLHLRPRLRAFIHTFAAKASPRWFGG